ncbi:MAG: AAA family ATPase [Eubacterium sp.]
MSDDKKKTTQGAAPVDKQKTGSTENSGPENRETPKTVDARTLAEHLYDLDKLVYELSGSSLGRVFTNDRDRNVTIIEKAMIKGHEHIIRSEMALIGNMARTIQDKDDHFKALSAYNDVFNEFSALAAEPGSIIASERDVDMNELNLNNRFTRDNRLIICINCSYGCAANNVGLGIADALHINYYDAEIFMRLIQRTTDAKGKVKLTRAETDIINAQMGAGNPGLSYQKQKLTLKEHIARFNRYHGLSARDAYFFTESELLLQMAKEKDFVVMGRCADCVMHSNNIPHVSIFLTAPEERRIRRIMEVNGVNERAARRQMHQVDKQRSEYYEFFTNHRWDDAANYDITLNTSMFGVRGSIDFILQILDNAGLGGKRE